MTASDTVDVIVVGAGAGGCVVAARLAEFGAESVLLIEAGPDLRTKPPAALRDGWGISPSEFDWGLVSEPNPVGNTQNVWRTRAVGGTGWLTRFAPRGAPADYDAWADFGCTGWSFEDVLPYFIAIEDDVDFGAEPWHGRGGPMQVSRYYDRDYSEAAARQIAAALATGLPTIEDHNKPGAAGVGRMPMSTRAGRRVTTADAYLAGNGVAPNLTIRADTLVASLTFDAARVTGVQLLGGETVAAARVVLSAGVYGNPPILMRSGIGPADELSSLGIDVRLDLPGVGANLADHPVVDMVEGELDGEPPREIMHWIATFRSTTTPAAESPDLMFWGSDPEEGQFELGVVLLKPRSRGRVRLRSADPAAPPLIELPALSDPFDVERLAEAYRRALDVAGQCGVAPPAPRDDSDLREHIRKVGRSLPHVVGTCAMGARPENGAVVDSDGRVHGCEGLAIADASIMPDVPSGFTHFPTIMIAERIAERIRAATP